MREAVIGSTIIIPCKSEGYPAPKIVWTHNDTQVTGCRFEVLKDGLKIQGVRKIDEGLYKCRATNRFGIHQGGGKLIVKLKTEIRTSPEDLQVSAGNPATFRCSASADDSLDLEIIWLRRDRPINYQIEPRFKVTVDNTLIISNTVEVDSGTYTCRAKTALDSQEVSASLIVQSPPNQPKILGVKYNGSAVEIEN